MLPPGLSLDPGTGVISGTPVEVGSWSFTLEVTDQAGGTATEHKRIDTVPTLEITSDPVPGGEVGATYDAVPRADHVTGIPTWSIVDGSLPDGLTLDPSSGRAPMGHQPPQGPPRSPCRSRTCRDRRPPRTNR